MDRVDPEQDLILHAVGRLLRRHRSTLTFDERERLERRLAQARSPRRRRRSGARLSRAILVAVGFVFTTAGTGLALSGFASDGTAEQAQYPKQAIVPLAPRGRRRRAGHL